jgi:hypothetical protein
MSTDLERIQYGYDADSRRTWRRRVETTGYDYAYGYDGLSQVTASNRGSLNLNQTAISGIPVAQQSWEYDPTGNWQGSVGVAFAGESQQRVHDKGNRLMQVDTPGFSPINVETDRAGQMTQLPHDRTTSAAVTWDAWGRVCSYDDGVATAQYSYDGLSRRNVEQSSSVPEAAVYYSDGWKPLQRSAVGSTAPKEQFLWGARHRDDLVRRERAPSGSGPMSEVR